MRMPSPVVAWSAHDHVAGLLAAEGVAAGAHRLEHVAVADRGLRRPGRRPPPSPGRSRGCSSRSPPRCRRRSRPGLGQAEGQDREQLVAVDVVPLVVDGQAAVGVAVEGDADVGAVLDHGRAAAAPRWVEPQPSLMLSPSGSAPITTTSAPAAAQRHRGGLGGGAVGAVDDDLEPGQRAVERARAGGRRTPRPGARRGGPGRRRAPVGRSQLAAEELLDLPPRAASSSLTPPRARNLMPLSGIGLCEALMTTPRSASSAVGQVGDAGGRQHPQPEHVDPGATPGRPRPRARGTAPRSAGRGRPRRAVARGSGRSRRGRR